MKCPDYRTLQDFVQDVAAPAVLYFPPEVLDQLNELCELKAVSPGQLISEALKSQDERHEQFLKEVTTPLKPDEIEILPEDPLYILACVVTIHLFRTLHKRLQDPAAFEEVKKNAPVEWSFASIEDQDEVDRWKSAE